MSEGNSEFGPADALLCVSDHGLRDGVHTEDAVWAQNHSDASLAPGHVLEVASAIDSIAPRRNALTGRRGRHNRTASPPRSQSVFETWGTSIDVRH